MKRKGSPFFKSWFFSQSTAKVKSQSASFVVLSPSAATVLSGSKADDINGHIKVQWIDVDGDLDGHSREEGHRSPVTSINTIPRLMMDLLVAAIGGLVVNVGIPL